MTDELKIYRLSPEEIESFLQNNYKNKIEPVDSVKLRQLQQRQKLQNLFKARNEKLKVPKE